MAPGPRPRRPRPPPLTADEMRELNQFLRAIGESEFPHPRTIWYGWWQWFCLHRQVEVQLYALVKLAIRRGHLHYGISPLWEVMRWDIPVEKTEEFKCRNAWRSRYSRYLMWKYRDIDGFFDLEKLRRP